MSQDQFTIEELSAASGVPSRTIRYYQSEGYLPGPKRLARRAIYSREHLERLQRIVAERSIKTLSEIKSDHADEEAIESGRSPRPAASRFEEMDKAEEKALKAMEEATGLIDEGL